MKGMNGKAFADDETTRDAVLIERLKNEISIKYDQGETVRVLDAGAWRKLMETYRG